MADIEIMLGGLVSSVERLQRDIAEIKLNMREDAQAASESRAALHQRVDTLIERVVSVEKDVLAQVADLADVREVTDEVAKWKAAGMGALGVTGLAAGAVSATITTYWSDLLTLFRGH